MSSNQVKMFMVVGGHEKVKEFPAAADGVNKDMPAAIDVMDKEASAAADMVCKEMPITTDPVDKEMHDVVGVAGKKMPMVVDDEMLADMEKDPEWREIPEYGQTATGPPMAE